MYIRIYVYIYMYVYMYICIYAWLVEFPIFFRPEGLARQVGFTSELLRGRTGLGR